ncbi:MAG: peptidase U32 family protein [Catonella sp.]|uniref:peptidase U32 family protein n=1 Tax=Catonella sp. TaxID=2382125 RepID=UPI003FA04827
MNKKREIEILAPAGSVDRMKAAFSGGADACYIGGKNFGARAYADNPEEKELVDAIYYAHVHDKKLYMTINTLIKEDEMKGLYNYVLPYYKAGIDAVLVQDFGVLKFLHENFPDLVLHASTQMTVCDTGAVRLLKQYDVKRIVLSRELSLVEVAAFKKEKVEIECFVHGALCVCYSGQCLMSAMNGGRSGNRGSCAGPCRMSYNLYAGNQSGGIRPTEKLETKPYLLSPKDICTLDLIPDMVEAGIDSFKIEGRMKRPEYAALTAYLYRKWTDIYLEYGKEYFNLDQSTRERNADVEKLSDIYNRGSFTKGYLVHYNGEEMMSNTRPNHNGVLVGSVKNVITNGKKNVIVINLTKDINAHDVVEIRADDKPTEPVYEFTLKDGKRAGESFEANFTKGLQMRVGLSVYRTKNETLLENINTNIIKEPIKKRIKASFYAEPDNELMLTLYTENSSITVNGAVCMRAEKRPIEAGRVVEALMKLGDTEFVIDKNDVEITLIGEVFFPISALNELRRNACDALYKALAEKNEKIPPAVSNNTNKLFPVPDFNPRYEIVVSTMEQLKALLKFTKNNKEEFEIFINLEHFGLNNLITGLDLVEDDGRKAYLRLPEIFRRSTHKKYVKYFDTVDGLDVLLRINGFMVRNLEEISFVKDMIEIADVPLDMVADTNLYTFNSKAVESLAGFDVHHYTVSLEQSLREAKLVRSNITTASKLSLVVYGREELMVMTQCQWKNKGACIKKLKKGQKPLPDILYIENKKNKAGGEQGKFPVVKNCDSCTNYVYQDIPINLFNKMDEIKELSPDFLRFDFLLETESEVREVIKLANFSK